MLRHNNYNECRVTCRHGGHVVQRIRGEAGAVPRLLAGAGPGPVRCGRLLARAGTHNVNTLRPALQRDLLNLLCALEVDLVENKPGIRQNKLRSTFFCLLESLPIPRLNEPGNICFGH